MLIVFVFVAPICRYCTCTLAVWISYRWQQPDHRYWYDVKHFCSSHSLYRERKSATIFMWHCRSSVNRWTYRICTASSTRQAMKNWSKRLDGIISLWTRSFGANACRMRNGHCAIWTETTSSVIHVRFEHWLFACWLYSLTCLFFPIRRPTPNLCTNTGNHRYAYGQL